jgi:hypothetical protein
MPVYHFYDESEAVPFRYLSPTRQVGQLPLPYQTTMSPSAYVEFAIEDLASGTTRGMINALGNVKRAIHLLIDALLNQYGLFAHFRTANFPAKLQVLDEIGLLPVGIMTNLNVERNLLEHEYSTPTKQRVAEAVDVSKLLLMATEKLLEATPHEALVGWRVPNLQLLLRLEPQIGEIRFHTIRAPKHYQTIHGVPCIVGGIRQLLGDKLHPWIKIGVRPWRTIVLNKTQRDEWRPVIRQLVNVQRQSLSRKTFVAPGAASATIPITVPLDLPVGFSWTEVLDRALSEKMTDQQAPAKTGQKKLPQPTQSTPADEPPNQALEPRAHEGHERRG